MNGCFITGTDTNAGKTVACVKLMHALRARGYSVIGMKPIASGAYFRDGKWLQPDVEALRTASNQPADLHLINPYCFIPPISPHLAAAEAGISIELRTIERCLTELRQQASLVLVEGAGGWRTPISNTHSMADLTLALRLPVILVVGLRLGCLNHAFLTAESIEQAGSRWIGWCASQCDPQMQHVYANLDTLIKRLPVPYLGLIPTRASPYSATETEQLDLNPLLALAKVS